MLDSTLAELHPRVRRDVPADDPYMHPMKSDHLQQINALVDQALALAGALNSDEDEPLLALCDAAGLTRWEYEAVVLHADGEQWAEIAERQHVTEAAVISAAIAGETKLRQFVASEGRLV